MKLSAYQYPSCRVLRIVDGDTVDLMINLGFDLFTKKRVRLYGIDAPETRTRDLIEKKKGKETKQRLTDLILGPNAAYLEDARVDLESHDWDKYGRVLGTLWVGDLNVNRQLVVEGFAREYDGGKR